MSDEDQIKRELEKLIDERVEKAKYIIENIQNIQSSEQKIIDISNPAKCLLKLPIGFDLSGQVYYWNQANVAADKVINNLKPSFVTALASTSSTATFGMLNFIEADYSSLPHGLKENAIVSQEKLKNAIFGSEDKKKVRNLMKKFNLEKTSFREKTAIQHFETAWSAFERQVTQDVPVNTSLIPLRSAIDTIITELLRQRPIQEETKTNVNKILSIGRQLAFDHITDPVIQYWALQWGEAVKGLESKLSNSKKAIINRDEWQNLLIQGTLFIKELLLGIDISKFKKR